MDGVQECTISQINQLIDSSIRHFDNGSFEKALEDIESFLRIKGISSHQYYVYMLNNKACCLLKQYELLFLNKNIPAPLDMQIESTSDDTEDAEYDVDSEYEYEEFDDDLLEEAMLTIKKAIAKDKSHYFALATRGRIYQLKADSIGDQLYVQAKQDFEQALVLGFDDEVFAHAEINEYLQEVKQALGEEDVAPELESLANFSL
jgi:hypothetical protein